jgi:hypothetical protein
MFHAHVPRSPHHQSKVRLEMRSDYNPRRADRSRLASVPAAIALIASLALLAPTSAFAEPKGIFKIFNQCPTENKEVTRCLYDKTTSGEFSLGTSKVPISKSLVLQGGLLPIGSAKEYYLLAAKNNETLSKTELTVPGGLTGVLGCEEIRGEGLSEKIAREECQIEFEHEETSVTATIELVASAKHFAVFNEAALGEEKGTALTLLVRLHLKNPLLGSACYVGSEANPVKLTLTTGETHPPTGFKALKGAFGKQETLEEKGETALRITGDSLVENDFSEPAAEGCGGVYSFLIDPIIDRKLKLPSKAGESVAIFDGELNLASSEAVIASEKF